MSTPNGNKVLPGFRCALNTACRFTGPCVETPCDYLRTVHGVDNNIKVLSGFRCTLPQECGDGPCQEPCSYLKKETEQRYETWEFKIVYLRDPETGGDTLTMRGAEGWDLVNTVLTLDGLGFYAFMKRRTRR